MYKDSCNCALNLHIKDNDNITQKIEVVRSLFLINEEKLAFSIVESVVNQLNLIENEKKY